MKFARYDSYKDSGVRWLGNLPNKWIPTHLKRGSLLIKDGTHGSFKRIDKGIPLLSVRNIVKTNFVRLSDDSFISEEDYELITKTFKVKTGDIQLAIVGTLGKVAIVSIKEPFATQRSLATIRINKKLFNNKYVFYFLQSVKIKEYLWMNTNFSAQPGVYLLTINNIIIPKFDINLQKDISNILSQKISQIDKKIDLLQEKRGSYEELKKSLINETVCRGLNKDVELKDSGIEWIGKIPKHWKLVRLKDLSKNIFAGGTPSTRIELYWNKKEIIWLPSGELQNNIMKKHSKNKYISTEGLLNSSTKMIEPNTTLIALTGATCANVGYLTFQACANQSVVAITNSKEFISKYLFYYLLSKRNYIETFKTGGAQAGINTQDVKYIIFPKSPKKEQIQIAYYLNDKTSKIDKIISKINGQMETLKEFRKTLINDVVTGKVRIQDE
jgi:type I restriction enzyme S subunit